MNKSPRDILLEPIVTEKSMQESSLGKYTFCVHSKANKIEIRKAVENIFKVNVLRVNIVSVRGKLRRMGKYQGKTSDWKKAIVTLKEGQKIELGGVSLFEQ